MFFYHENFESYEETLKNQYGIAALAGFYQVRLILFEQFFTKKGSYFKFINNFFIFLIKIVDLL
jgi:hypothetical protein